MNRGVLTQSLPEYLWEGVHLHPGVRVPQVEGRCCTVHGTIVLGFVLWKTSVPCSCI